MATRKEVHFFDRNEVYNKGIHSYLKYFRVWNESSPTIQGEATPYYIAHRKACKRMKTSIPNIKLIILLRNPVSRAYSEYQMKKRRVAEQDSFFFQIQQNLSAVYDCFLRFPQDLDNVKLCVPVEVSGHTRWSKLRTAVEHSLEKNETWSDLISACFPGRHPVTVDTAGNSGSCDAGELGNMSCKMDFNSSFGFSHSLEGNKESFSVEESGFLIRKNTLPGPSINSSVENKRTSNLSSGFLDSFIRGKQKNKKLKPAAQKPFSFDPLACFVHYKSGFETLKTMEEAFVDEIQEFQQCYDGVKSAVEFFPVEDQLTGYLETLDQAVGQCLRVRSGITSQYFYRSLYAVQLYHCFQHVDPDNILVLPSESLRHRPREALSSVLRFLGLLPSGESGVSVAADAQLEKLLDLSAHDAVEVFFPNFERSTGWRLNGDYDQMSEGVARSLHDFFQPHNEKLFELLGADISEMW